MIYAGIRWHEYEHWEQQTDLALWRRNWIPATVCVSGTLHDTLIKSLAFQNVYSLILTSPTPNSWPSWQLVNTQTATRSSFYCRCGGELRRPLLSYVMGSPRQCRRALGEIWPLGSNPTGSRLRDSGVHCGSMDHVHKLPHAPHSTAAVVLKGHKHFSPPVFLWQRRTWPWGRAGDAV